MLLVKLNLFYVNCFQSKSNYRVPVLLDVNGTQHGFRLENPSSI